MSSAAAFYPLYGRHPIRPRTVLRASPFDGGRSWTFADEDAGTKVELGRDLDGKPHIRLISAAGVEFACDLNTSDCDRLIVACHLNQPWTADALVLNTVTNKLRLLCLSEPQPDTGNVRFHLQEPGLGKLPEVTVEAHERDRLKKAVDRVTGWDPRRF